MATKRILLTLPEAAAILRVTRQFVSQLALGKVRSMPMLESVRLGKRVLIRTSTLERYIAAMETTAAVKQ